MMNDNGIGSMNGNEDVEKMAATANKAVEKLQRENPHVAIIGCGGEGRARLNLEQFHQFLLDNPREAKRFNQCFNCWMLGTCNYNNEKYEDENGLCTKCESKEQHMAKLVESLVEPREAEFYIPERKDYLYEGYNRAARRRQKKSGKRRV
jgi:hypothetical protein